MSDWLLLLAAALLAFFGCASLALSLPCNWMAVAGAQLRARDGAIMRRRRSLPETHPSEIGQT